MKITLEGSPEEIREYMKSADDKKVNELTVEITSSSISNKSLKDRVAEVVEMQKEHSCNCTLFVNTIL